MTYYYLKKLRSRMLDRTARRARRDERRLRAVLRATLRTDTHTIDVGAHKGLFLADLVRCAPYGRHLAYEPLPDLATALARQFPTVEVRNAALSDHAGSTTFQHVVDRPALSGIRRRLDVAEGDVTEIEVPLERLDDSLPPGMRPGFIKVDVEGAELEVFRGAREVLREFRPTVVFEHGELGAGAYDATPGEVHALLAEAGLRIYDLSGSGPFGRAEFEHLFATHAGWNWVAR